MNRTIYETPLADRYASKEMSTLFSQDTKFKTWRALWIALAEAEMDLGLPITQDQIDEMTEHKDIINYEEAEKKEKEVRHDVMAHVYAFGQQCPKARGIIHLGATSCYVGDNTDLIIMRRGLGILKQKLIVLMRNLSSFADLYKTMPTLAFTHFQPAQPTTVGKRASLWLQDILMDYHEIDRCFHNIRFLGSKGATGTQASFVELFEGDKEKVSVLDTIISQRMGFDNIFTVSGQTYPRKLDAQVLNALSGLAQSASKFANDIRLLQHLKEIEEPFETGQIGSSAMAYKRNPMRSERICALSRHLIVNAMNPALTASTQWFERTLDDSANKRLSMAEGFLVADAILNLYINITDGLVIYPAVIDKHLKQELPFMMTENILMEAVKKGGDRQELHEKIRRHSMEAGLVVKEKGEENDLLYRIARDPDFQITIEELHLLMQPEHYIGCAAEQVKEFLEWEVYPVLEKHRDTEVSVEINV